MLPPLDTYKSDPVVNVRHNLALCLRPDPSRDFVSLDNEKVKAILLHLSNGRIVQNVSG